MRHIVGPPVCPTMENPDLVLKKAGDSQSPTHSRLAECHSRQANQARPDHPGRIVPSRGFPVNMLPVEPASSRPVWPPGSTTNCLNLYHWCQTPWHWQLGTQPTLERSGHLSLPTGSHLGQSGEEVAGLPKQENHLDC